MNAPVIQRSILKHHVATIESRYALDILGLVPADAVGHLRGENALGFLARKREGLTLLDLAGAEIDLAELLGRPVGIVLESGLKDEEAVEIPKLVEPL